MPTVDFKPFATGAGANVEDQATFNVDAALSTGVSAGTARSALANKVWRQSSFVTAALATFVSQQTGLDVLDNGDLTAFTNNFGAALADYIQNNVIFQKFLTGNVNYYVGGISANDANSGTLLTAPWATLGRAVSEIQKFNLNGYTIQVNCTGPFSAPIIIPTSISGNGQVIFTFAAGSSITVATGAAISAANGAKIQINGPVTLSATQPTPFLQADGCAIYCSNSSQIVVTGGPAFAGCTGAHMIADSGASIPIVGGYTINGGAPIHVAALNNGIINFANNASAMTVSLIGTPGFSNAFAIADSLGDLRIPSTLVAFAGSGATGIRFRATANAIINTSGGATTYLPGTSAGGTATGGQYL